MSVAPYVGRSGIWIYSEITHDTCIGAQPDRATFVPAARWKPGLRPRVHEDRGYSTAGVPGPAELMQRRIVLVDHALGIAPIYP